MKIWSKMLKSARDPVVWAKMLIALCALYPLARLVLAAASGSLGADPGKTMTRELGLAALQLLIATLAMTPLRRLTGWRVWLRSRRMLGLFSLFYACLHVLAYLQFIAGWQDILGDVVKRPFITLGFSAFVLMVPLGLTSTRGMMRRLGKRWARLHRSIYLIVVLAWLHFLWQARSDISIMVYYGALILVLLGMRLWWKLRAGQGAGRAMHRASL